MVSRGFFRGGMGTNRPCGNRTGQLWRLSGSEVLFLNIYKLEWVGGIGLDWEEVARCMAA